jgi:hypothetical protein
LEVFINGEDALSKCCLTEKYKDIPTLLNNGNKVIDDYYILVREVDYEKLKANPPKPFVCGWGSNKKGVEVKNSNGEIIHSFISIGETAKFFGKSEWKIKEILHRKENGFWKEENLYLKFKNNENE